MYSPKEIASTKYGLEANPNYVTISKEELDNKLKYIINNHVKYEIDMDKIKEIFSFQHN